MTPFRYSVINPNGSRFRRPNALLGVFYASEHALTAVAEMAFTGCCFTPNRLRHRIRTILENTPVSRSRWPVIARSIQRGAAVRHRWPALIIWGTTRILKAFADQAREARIEVIRYRSLRDPEHTDQTLPCCRRQRLPNRSRLAARAGSFIWIPTASVPCVNLRAYQLHSAATASAPIHD